MTALEQIDELRELVAEGEATPDDMRWRIEEHREQQQAARYDAVDRAAEERSLWR